MRGRRSAMDNRYDLNEKPGEVPVVTTDQDKFEGLHAQLFKLESQNEALLLTLEDVAKRERRLRAFLENSYDVLFTLDAGGQFSFVSPAWERHFGYPVDSVLGTHFTSVIHPDDIADCTEFLNQVMGNGLAGVSLPFRIGHANGTWRIFETTGSPFIETDGTLLFAGVAHDITDRTESEALLRESNDRFDQLAKQSGTITWEINAQGLFTYMSHLSWNILGFHPDEVVGQLHFYDLCPEPGRQLLRNSTLAAMRRKEPFKNVELSMTSRDGKQLWFSSNGIPVLEGNGELRGYRGSYSDITESRKLKEQLYQSQKMEAVGELAGGLAHDFNNVLSIINGYCSLMKMELERDEPHWEFIDRIQAASERASELTRGMLTFSRTQEIHQQSYNLNSIVAAVGTLTKRIIGEHINFTIKPTITPLPIYVDSSQIEQVLINLVNNAKDAMPSGGELTICTDYSYVEGQLLTDHGIEKPGEYAVVMVTDTGSGMDEATVQRIFEPFFTTKEVGKGTGLGLAMVYGIVKQHNGFLDVTSKPGEGTSFMVFLPIIESHFADFTVTCHTVVEQITGSETVLIVEDDVELLEFMKKLLNKLGYRVITAVDGHEAVAQFREHAETIDLIVMDLIMPRMGGKQAYDEIRQLQPNVRVLFCSGHNISVAQQQGHTSTTVDFIPKPVTMNAFLTKVREMLDAR